MEKKGKDDIKEGLISIIRKTKRITRDVVEGFRKGYRETSNKEEKKEKDG